MSTQEAPSSATDYAQLEALRRDAPVSHGPEVWCRLAWIGCFPLISKLPGHAGKLLLTRRRPGVAVKERVNNFKAERAFSSPAALFATRGSRGD